MLISVLEPQLVKINNKMNVKSNKLVEASVNTARPSTHENPVYFMIALPTK